MAAESNLSSYELGMRKFESRSKATIAVETSVLIFFALIAIAGNVLVVTAFIRNRSIRTITNYFVLSLSALDLLITGTVLPPTLMWSIKSRFSSNYQPLCDFQSVWSAGLILISIINITFTAINRYVCVCKPRNYKRLFNHKSSVAMIISFWVVGFGVMISAGYVGDGIHSRFSPFKIMCLYVYSNKTNKNTSFIIKFLPQMLFLGLPFSIMIFCYYNVFKTIRQHKRNIAPSRMANRIMGNQSRGKLSTNGRSWSWRNRRRAVRNNGRLETNHNAQEEHDNNGQSKVRNNDTRNGLGNSQGGLETSENTHSRLGTSVQEIKITRTLFAVLFAYCCTWIPFFSVLLAANVVKQVPREIQMLVSYTAVASSAINPVIYGVYNKAFRQEYKKTFGYLKLGLTTSTTE